MDSNTASSQRELMDAVWGAISKLYGEFGASLTSLAPIDYDAEKKLAIVRTNLEALGIVRTSIASITSIKDAEATVHILAISGTIKALRQKLRI
jgi:RNase P/RNase MRP subunit POP5